MAEKQYRLAKPAEEIDKIINTALTYGTSQTLTASEKNLVLQKLGIDLTYFKIRILGYFNNLQALQSAIKNPSAGDSYGVGTAYPYDIYVWDAISSRWINNGPLEGAPGKDGVDAEVTNTSVTEALGYTPGMVNPNLLDNWYFVNPVNQGGQTSYAGTVIGLDRWFGSNSSTVVALETGGIRLSGSTSPALYQKIDNFSHYRGKQMTASVLVSELNPANTFRLIVRFGTGSSDAYLSQNYVTLATGLNKLSFTVPANADTMRVGVYSVEGAIDMLVQAIKLEIGSVQTLARQKANGWVLNEIPDYGEQLARCQRHQIVLGSTSGQTVVGSGFASSATEIRANIPLPATMRARPVVKWLTGDISGLRIIGEGQQLTPTNITVNIVHPTGVYVVFSVSGATVSGSYVVLVPTGTTARPMLDANI